MELKYNQELKNLIWKEHHKALMANMPKEIRDQYQFVFAMADYKSLLCLENPAIVEQIRLRQACMIESMIKMSLDEIMHPLKYQTEMPSLDEIQIRSQCKLGEIHCIRENPKDSGFVLFRKAGEVLSDQVVCDSVDDLIDHVSALEQTWREKRSIKIDQSEGKS